MIHFEGNTTLDSAYEKFVADLWIRRTRVLCILAIISIAAGAVLDWAIYTELFIEFVEIRLITNLLLGLLLAVLYFRPAHAYHRVLGLCWMVLPIWHLTLMIAISDGIVSPYYIGIILVIMGASLFMPWTIGECSVAFSVTWCFYASACLANWLFMPGQGAPNQSALANNAFFMAIFPLIGLAASHVSSGSRYREFKLRFDLDQNKRELEISYHKLAALDDAKSQFFAHISHELRTPLTLILSPLDDLRTTLPAALNGKFRETLDLMYGNALRLLSLINDLLELIRLDEGKLKLDLKPVSLRTVLLGLISSMRAVAEKGRVSIEADFANESPLMVNADADRLEKVFINLLFNAIKFTPEDGHVRVKASEDASSVVVQIEDTGIGISEEKLTAVFERFWQDDENPIGAAHGTGIGLALVRQLVELHAGSVSVSSRKGAGSVFTVRLPKQLEASNENAVETAPRNDAWLTDLYRKAQRFQSESDVSKRSAVSPFASNPAKHTLLLVEDEVDMQRYLADELGRDYNVLVAADGEAGYNLAASCQPEIVLTDLMLPKIDGITLCGRIKSSPSILPSKIVLLTARADDRTKLSALEAGADDFVTKPFSMVELKTRLANLLLTSQLERELQKQNQTLEQTLTQLRAAETQLIQTERLSALGNLSAGIMHEINNPVNFMLTAIHFLRSKTTDASNEISETIVDIENGLKRVRDIIADLKGFAYGSSSVAKIECDPEKILRTAKRLLAHDLSYEVELKESIVAGARPCANENQMVQLVVNLIQNAIHATRSNPSRNKPRLVGVRMGAEKGRYEISVQDNGTGIPKDHENKIFDPFFTTKPVGEGTGLGLSICHTIVKGHQGRIFATSDPGEGTKFVVQLPALHPAGLEAAVSIPNSSQQIEPGRDAKGLLDKTHSLLDSSTEARSSTET
ncbi:MAG: ATP-binding protein [Verrucomicrobia bacterium]|nr:ATP-binding protein [Verrucomicrobiota bacterium]